MKINPLIYIFSNYIVSLLIFIHAIIKKVSLFEYLTRTVFILIGINIIFILINIISKSLKIQDNHTFELNVGDDGQDLKELLKEDINETENDNDDFIKENSYDI